MSEIVHTSVSSSPIKVIGSEPKTPSTTLRELEIERRKNASKLEPLKEASATESSLRTNSPTTIPATRSSDTTQGIFAYKLPEAVKVELSLGLGLVRTFVKGGDDRSSKLFVELGGSFGQGSVTLAVRPVMDLHTGKLDEITINLRVAPGNRPIANSGPENIKIGILQALSSANDENLNNLQAVLTNDHSTESDLILALTNVYNSNITNTLQALVVLSATKNLDRNNLDQLQQTIVQTMRETVQVAASLVRGDHLTAEQKNYIVQKLLPGSLASKVDSSQEIKSSDLTPQIIDEANSLLHRFMEQADIKLPTT